MNRVGVIVTPHKYKVIVLDPHILLAHPSRKLVQRVILTWCMCTSLVILLNGKAKDVGRCSSTSTDILCIYTCKCFEVCTVLGCTLSYVQCGIVMEKRE